MNDGEGAGNPSSTAASRPEGDQQQADAAMSLPAAMAGAGAAMMATMAAPAAVGAALAASAMTSGLNAAAELSQTLTGNGSNSDANGVLEDEPRAREADVAPSPESSNDLA